MAIISFPPHDAATEDGLLAVGGDLEVESLLCAYGNGIFPWPLSRRYELLWFSPHQRSLLFFSELHISKSMQKLRRNNPYTFTINKHFEEVIKQCRQTRIKKGTWITKNMMNAYIDLHYAGYCHSIECLKGTALVGGLYGVSIGHSFAGESMFSLESNTSKLSLLFLVDFLTSHGVAWIDCQQQTDLLSSFGAKMVPRSDFLSLLRQVKDRPPLPWPKGGCAIS